MLPEDKLLTVDPAEMELLKKLVSEELDRRCAAVDNIIVQGYGEWIGKRAESNQEAVKGAVLELVRSPLALLELDLAALSVEEKEKPEEKPAVEAEAEAETE